MSHASKQQEAQISKRQRKFFHYEPEWAGAYIYTSAPVPVPGGCSHTHLTVYCRVCRQIYQIGNLTEPEPAASKTSCPVEPEQTVLEIHLKIRELKTQYIL